MQLRSGAAAVVSISSDDDNSFSDSVSVTTASTSSSVVTVVSSPQVSTIFSTMSTQAPSVSSPYVQSSFRPPYSVGPVVPGFDRVTPQTSIQSLSTSCFPSWSTMSTAHVIPTASDHFEHLLESAPNPGVGFPGDRSAHVADRAAKRRAATHHIKLLQDHLSADESLYTPSQRDDLDYAVMLAEESFNSLMLLQAQGQLDSTSTHIPDLRQLIFKCKRKSERLQNQFQRQTLAAPSTSAPLNQQNVASPFQMAPMVLPKFTGNPSEWNRFWSLFSVAIHNNVTYPPTLKLLRLLSLLEGDAAQLVQGIHISDENYPVVVQLLQNKFVDNRARREELLQSFIGPNLSSVDQLPKLYNEVSAAYRQLLGIGIGPEQYAVGILPQLIKRLPVRTQELWIRHQRSLQREQSYEGEFITFVEFLDEEVKTQERIKRQPTPRTIVNQANHPQGSSQSSGRPNSGIVTMVPSVTPRQQNSSSGNSTNTSVPASQPDRKNSSASRLCNVCKEPFHLLVNCNKFMMMTPQQRSAFLKTTRQCFRCFRKHDSGSGCTSTKVCPHCNSTRHHRLLCFSIPANNSSSRKSQQPALIVHNSGLPTNQSTSVSNNTSADSSVVTVPSTPIAEPSTSAVEFFPQSSFVTVPPANPTSSAAQHQPTPSMVATLPDPSQKSPFENRRVFLKTCSATIHGTVSAPLPIFVFLDDGAKRSYILESVAKKLDLHVLQAGSITTGSFGGMVKHEYSTLVEFWADTISGKRVKLEAWTTPAICPPFQQETLPSWPARFAALSPWGETFDGSTRNVSILIGADQIDDIVTGNPIVCPGFPKAYPTVFGYTLCGSYRGGSDNKSTQDDLALVAVETWELSDLGIGPPLESDTKAPLPVPSPDFPPKYRVRIPFRGAKRPASNYYQALRRHDRLLETIPKEKLPIYENEFEKLQANKIIEIAPTPWFIGFFLPHHAVFTLLKCRIVFDGSAKDRNGVSINSCLDPGPNLLRPLLDVLLLSRRFQYLQIGDVRAAFHMVEVDPADRHWIKLIWKGQIYQFAFVPFGLSVSPFLLHSTVQHHFHTSPTVPSNLAQTYLDSLYCDDLIMSHADRKELTSLMNKAVEIFAAAGMELRLFDVSKSVLGVGWDQEKDVYFVKTPDSPTDKSITRRSLLALVSSVYDPLGILSPWVVVGRALVQRSCQETHSWDTPLSSELQSLALDWAKDISLLHQVQIPRCLHLDLAQSLHVFCDASSKAFSCVAYVVSSVGTHFVFAKSRVAPTSTTLTIPRLELMGILIGARFLSHLATVYKTSLPCFVWSDSTTVLHWIQNKGPSKRDDFVQRRIDELLTFSTLQFRYIPTDLNPADFPSRGGTISDLLNNSLYLNGPAFLRNPEALWPSTALPVVTAPHPTSKIPPKAVDKILPPGSHSSFASLIGILGYINRFIHNSRFPTQRRHGPLSSAERQTAKTFLIKREQAEFFASELENLEQNKPVSKSSHLWRLRPCLHGDLICLTPRNRSNLRPIIPRDSELVSAIIQDAHFHLMHQNAKATLEQLRMNFWIPRAQTLVKRFVRECKTCKRLLSRPYTSPEGQLPLFRVSSTPWLHTGLDYFGPILIGEQKFYCLLFTCANIRAIHLELTSSVSASDTFLAIQRFLSRRVPLNATVEFHSDNGTYFHRASVMNFRRYNIQWHFIPSATPQWGGWWERLIRTIKRSIRITLTKRKLSPIWLETFLHELEAIINARPLLQQTDDPDAPVLTPNHFLHAATFPNFDSSSVFEDNVLRKAFRLKELALKDFWKIWSTSYLSELVEWRRRPNCSPDLKEGDIVLVQSNSPRQTWPLARIIQLLPSSDGITRAAKLIYFRSKLPALDVQARSRFMITRSIITLHPLEAATSSSIPLPPTPLVTQPTQLGTNDEEVEEAMTDADPVVDIGHTRTRKIRRPERFRP